MSRIRFASARFNAPATWETVAPALDGLSTHWEPLRPRAPHTSSTF